MTASERLHSIEVSTFHFIQRDVDSVKCLKLSDFNWMVDYIRTLEKRNERLREAISDAALLVLVKDCSMCSAGSAREDLLEVLELEDEGTGG